jgi:hypothetical protein
MRHLNQVKLHELIGSATVWTDDLWDDALDYLVENTATPDAIVMAEIVLGDEQAPHLYKVDYLRDFRGFPPTVLLGAFDLMRYRKAASAELAARARRHSLLS